MKIKLILNAVVISLDKNSLLGCIIKAAHLIKDDCLSLNKIKKNKAKCFKLIKIKHQVMLNIYKKISHNKEYIILTKIIMNFCE